jgi:peptide/nickel transport system permease protein
MSEDNSFNIVTEAARPRVSELRRVVKVMFGRWIVTGGAVITVVLIIMAIFAPAIAPHDPNKVNLRETLAKPSHTYLLGTDELGRDVLSRTIYGSRISLLVGIVGVFVAGAIGMPLGLIAGYFGGWINIIIMRFIDALLALPPMVLILAIAAVLGGGLINVLIAIGIGMMPTYCRLMCGQILSVKENEYITASRSLGANNLRVMFLHLLPNTLPSLLVLITMNLGVAILMEAGLSYIGIGITPPTATWGSMVSDGYKYLLTNPLISFVPGVAILLVVLAFNMLGDGLRDALDPRLRGVI